MKLSIALLLLALLGLTGCGTTPYYPQEYPLRAGLIPKLSVDGSVEVRNSQDSEEPEIVYSYVGTKLASDYKSITQLMVNQTIEELGKSASYDSKDKKKTIDVKVTYLKSTYIAFYWRSELKYVAVLGGTKTIERTVKHGSGILIQDLNGCIAESVMDLLNQPEVAAYLGK